MMEDLQDEPDDEQSASATLVVGGMYELHGKPEVAYPVIMIGLTAMPTLLVLKLQAQILL